MNTCRHGDDPAVCISCEMLAQRPSKKPPAVDTLHRLGRTAATVLPPLTQSRQNKMACPHLYAEAEVRGRKMAPSPYANRGIEIHAFIETYLNHLVATKQPSDYEFFDSALTQFTGSTEAFEILGRMRESLVIDPERVLAVEPYLALDENLDPIDVDPTVPSHVLQQNPPGYVIYAGIPDVLLSPTPDHIDCWDWKSFFAIVEPETFQADFYPLLIFKHFPGVETVTFHLQFVRYGASRSVDFSRTFDLARLEDLARKERRRQKMLHHSTELHDEALAEGGTLSNDPLLEITAADLQAMPGPHCVYCPKLVPGIKAAGTDTGWTDDACPIASVNPFTEIPPDTRLRFAVWAKYAGQENSRILREFVKAGGPLEIVDSNGKRHIAGYDETATKVYPLFEVAELVRKWEEQTGDKISVKLRVGGTELNPLLNTKKRAGLQEQVEAVAFIKKATRWNIGKKGGDEPEEAANAPF